MNIYWWFLIGAGVAAYLWGWRYTVRLFAWAKPNQTEPLPLDVDNLDMIISMILGFVCVPIVMFGILLRELIRGIRYAIVSFPRLSSQSQNHINQELKRIFPPLSAEHRRDVESSKLRL